MQPKTVSLMSVLYFVSSFQFWFSSSAGPRTSLCQPGGGSTSKCGFLIPSLNVNFCTCIILNKTLQDIVIETTLGGKNSTQGPLLVKLLCVGLKRCLHLSQQNTRGPFKVSIIYLYDFSIR